MIHADPFMSETDKKLLEYFLLCSTKEVQRFLTLISELKLTLGEPINLMDPKFKEKPDNGKGKV